MGKTHGLKKEITPAKNARVRAGMSVASMISIPNIVFP
jgi:hypothetical protein